MVNTGSAVAHFVKLLVTAICMRRLAEPYQEKALPITYYWCLSAFRILFMHSILGIFRFAIPFTSASTSTARRFRSFYDWYSDGIEIFPLALLASGILSAYQVDKKIRMLLLLLGTVPLFFPFVIKQKEGRNKKCRLLTDIAIVLQILAIMIFGLRNSNYNVISLVVSYTFKRFFVGECCDRYSIPYTDLKQYCICFIEVFTVSTLKDLMRTSQNPVQSKMTKLEVATPPPLNEEIRQQMVVTLSQQTNMNLERSLKCLQEIPFGQKYTIRIIF